MQSRIGLTNDRRLLLVEISTAKNSQLIIQTTRYNDARELQQSLTTGSIININGCTELLIPDSVIDVVHCLSHRNKDGIVYTYNYDLIIPDDSSNEPHDGDEASDDENYSDYVETESMSSMDNFDDPPNTDDAYYGEPIAVVEYHEEEPYNKQNTNGHHQGHSPKTQQ